MQTTMSNKVDILDISTQKQFCTFWIADRLFGVDILHIKEINRELEFTPVFHAPKEVKGYVNIRGQIHLVLDLRLILGFDSRTFNSDNCVLIFKHTIAEPFGVLVDKIGDVVNVSEEKIEERSKVDDISTTNNESLTNNDNLIDGICKLDKTLLVILNARKLIGVIKS